MINRRELLAFAAIPIVGGLPHGKENEAGNSAAKICLSERQKSIITDTLKDVSPYFNISDIRRTDDNADIRVWSRSGYGNKSKVKTLVARCWGRHRDTKLTDADAKEIGESLAVSLHHQIVREFMAVADIYYAEELSEDVLFWQEKRCLMHDEYIEELGPLNYSEEGFKLYCVTQNPEMLVTMNDGRKVPLREASQLITVLQDKIPDVRNADKKDYPKNDPYPSWEPAHETKKILFFIGGSQSKSSAITIFVDHDFPTPSIEKERGGYRDTTSLYVNMSVSILSWCQGAVIC